MLGPVSQPRSTRPATPSPAFTVDESTEVQDDLIERLAARGARLPELPGESRVDEERFPGAMPDHSGDGESAQVARTTTRSVTIDLDRLARQSIITPGSGRTP